MFIEREIKLPSGSAAGIATREMRDPGSTTVYITYSSVQEFILLHINSVDTLELLPNHHLSSNSTSLNQCRPEERDARQIPRIRRDVFLLKNSVQPSRYIPELANIAGSNFREDDRWWGTASMPNPPCRASRRERESKTEYRFFGCTRHTDCSHTLRLPEKDSNNAAGLQ